MCQFSAPVQCASSVGLLARQYPDGVGQEVYHRRQALEGTPGRARQVEQHSAFPLTPAMPRESGAIGLERRMASAKPGAGRSMTSAVPSGVRSRGPNPVPPVVTMSPVNPDAILVRSPATEASPSGAADCSTTSNPASWSALATAGPLSSSRSPRMTESDTVSTLAW